MAEMKRTNPPRKNVEPAPLVTKNAQAGSPGTAAVRTIEALAAMGGGELAYIRAFRASELRDLFPQSADLHPAVQLFALFGADGVPLMLADSREAVISGAWQNDLVMATVH